MKEETIKEIKELNEEIRKVIKQHSEENQKIILDKDFVLDQAKSNFSEKLINEALIKGLHLKDNHLYPSNPNKKHKGKNYYCIYRYKENIFLVNYLLISYLKKDKIILFHISPLRFGSKEQKRYKEIIKNL